MAFIIKELAEAKDEGPMTSEWLTEKLLIQHQNFDLEEILNELVAKEILLRDHSGHLTFKESHQVNVMATTDQIRTFHKAAQEIATQAYDTTEKDQRTFHTSFVRLKKDRPEEAKKRILEFQKELTTFVEEGTAESVLYQVNLQLFPISKTID